MTDLKTLLKSTVTLLFVSALVLSLSACDSGGSNEEESINNRFSLTVTENGGGAAAKQATETLEGFSFFATGTDQETGEQGFAVYMSDDENFSQQNATSGLFGLAVRLSGLPGTGSYSVTEDGSVLEGGSDFALVLYKDFGSQSGTVYIANGGTIELTTSNNDRVEGTIDVQAEGFTFSGTTGETVSATITGSFTAKNVSTFMGTSFLQQ